MAVKRKGRPKPLYTKLNRLLVAVLAVTLALGNSLGLFGLPLRLAHADTALLRVDQAWPNSHYSLSKFMRGGSETGRILYCAQGYLRTPDAGQTLTHYGWLGIPELDYVLYHGYDGEVVTSVGGLDAERSETATMIAVWLAIGEQRADVLSYPVSDGTMQHGNKLAEERWQQTEDQAVKNAARALYDEGLAYKADGGGGPEARCSTYWSNSNVTAEGHRWYQGLLSVSKRVPVSFVKKSSDPEFVAGNSEYSLKGAVYDIFDTESGQKVTTVTTDAAGKAQCDLTQGKQYHAVEVSAPKGYVKSGKRVDFAAGIGTVVDLVDDPGTMRIIVHKGDSATGGQGQPGTGLDGAEYRFTSLSKPGWEATKTTDADGSLIMEGIPLGKVRMTETKAPAGYKLDPGVYQFDAKGGALHESGVTTFEKEVTETIGAFDFDIVKYKDSGADGSGLQQPVKGVRFSIISNTTGKTVGTITTDERGYASTADPKSVNSNAVAPGKTYDASKPWMGDGKRTAAHKGTLPYDAKGYTVHEDPATTPSGYQPCPDWAIAPEQAPDGATLHFIVDNDFVGSRIQIVKTDAASGQTVPLAGFTFQLLDSGKNPVSQKVWYPNHTEKYEFTTDDSGCVTLPEALKPGTYYVRETGAVAPYLRNGKDIQVVIGSSSSVPPITVVKVSDDQARGIGRIKKLCTAESCPWCSEANGERLLTGAEFDVIALDDVVSPDGTVQAVSGEAVDHVVVGNGVATTKELPLGAGCARYAFVETKAPAGHRLDPTPLEFTLCWEDDETKTVYAEVTSLNHPTEAFIEKTVAGTDTPLPGAQFDVWPDALEMSSDYGSEELGALAVTVVDGDAEPSLELTQMHDYAQVELNAPSGYGIHLVDSTGSSPIWEDELEPGTYEVTVTGPDGMRLDLGKACKVEVKAGHFYAVSYDAGILGWNAGLSIEESELPRASHGMDDFTGDLSETDVLTLDGIEPGSYELKVTLGEREASAQVSIAPGRRSFAVVEDGEVSERFHGLLPLMHRALTGVLDACGIDLTTDEDGRIDLVHLPARAEDLASLLENELERMGYDDDRIADAMAQADDDGSIAWHIQEVATPDGFIVDPSVRTFTIHDDGKPEGADVLEMEVENDYTKVEISKRDGETENLLEGAELVLIDAEGDEVTSWVSGAGPQRIDGLACGTYTLRETKSPQGHDVADDMEFAVAPVSDVQKIVMHDEPLRISGEVDKRQEIADPVADNTVENGDGLNRAEVKASDTGAYAYSLDFRSTSNTWTDEFTVEDNLRAVDTGAARLTGLRTAQAPGDYDGLMNVWYRTDQTNPGHVDESGANATLGDGHGNPWLSDPSTEPALGDDGRVLSYDGWRLWRADVPTTEATDLMVDSLDLTEGERIVGIRFEYGRVDEAFTTRPTGWDREDLKHEHDDVGRMHDEHKQTFEVERGKEVPYAPAVFHLEATDAYRDDAPLENFAFVDLFRNGGGEGLEDHDGDRVIQMPKTAEQPPATEPEPQKPEPERPQEPEPPARKSPTLPMPKTGDILAFGAAALATGGVTAIAAGLRRRRRRSKRIGTPEKGR